MFREACILDLKGLQPDRIRSLWSDKRQQMASKTSSNALYARLLDSQSVNLGAVKRVFDASGSLWYFDKGQSSATHSSVAQWQSIRLLTEGL
jgi:hypothetical protein